MTHTSENATCSDIPAMLQQALQLQNQGQLVAAETLYHQVLAMDPHNHDALHLLGLLALQVGMHEDALELIKGALAVKPDFHQAHRNIGIVYLNLERYQEALEHFLLAQSKHASDMALYLYIADALKGCGRWQDAITCYQQALLGGIENPAEVQTRIGRLQLSNGQIDLACEAFEQAWLLDPANADALYGLALADSGRLQDHHMRAVVDLLKEDDLEEEQTRIFNYILGSYYNRLGEYDWAFEYYTTGNKMRGYQYDVSRMAGKVGEIIQVFNQELIKGSKLESLSSSQPIFVLGLPRSGTSLVEQILASHSQVFGAGEIKALGQAIDKHQPAGGSGYPASVTKMDKLTLQKIASTYQQQLEQLSDSAPRVVDKRPGNVAHIGMIKLLFPDAVIILCQRDLRDVTISNYFLDFGDRQPWTHDLATMGAYVKHYRRLVNHWRNLCGSKLYVLEYESLVQNPEAEIKSLLDATGLPWEPACLGIRQPIYTSSIGRWKNYSKHLEVFFAASGVDADAGKFCY